MNDVFIFKDNIYTKVEDLSKITVKEFMDGPYLVKFVSEAFGNLYFAGFNDDLYCDLILKGKINFGIYKLIDLIVDFLRNRGVDYSRNVKGMMVDELLKQYDLQQRWTPDKITIVPSRKLTDAQIEIINKPTAVPVESCTIPCKIVNISDEASFANNLS